MYVVFNVYGYIDWLEQTCLDACTSLCFMQTAMLAMELKPIIMGMNKLQILLIAFAFVNTMSTGFASAARSTTMITASKNINKSHGQLDSGASVTIMNHVGGFITLECSSKDDNLGIHDLLNSQSYYFSFTPNYVGTTLFWCNVMWQQRTAHVVVWSGPGFLQLDPVPCVHCVWDLKPNGFYRSEAGGPFTFVQGWQYPAH
jgi:hypothetical protein